MKNSYVLVHGAWHDKRCWDKVASLLRAEGQEVWACHFPDCEQGKNEIYLNTYVEEVIALARRCQGDVVLVGHSMAGAVISQVAEAVPDEIAALIYVTAYIPETGSSVLLETRKTKQPSKLASEFWVDDQKKFIGLHKTPRVRDVFYRGCSQPEAEQALACLRPQPLGPMKDVVRLTKDNFGRIPKVYIACQEDEVLPIEEQQRMYERVDAMRVITLPTGHFPLFSHPELLSRTLLDQVALLHAQERSISLRARF
ncbi:MAG: alpha/beta fold hydrolase [Gammaproteobacteria bacterium]|nr:alpha/beta fold hydrolase [Gammaproteobacteria bacterium]